jgi:hypothetical protein
VTALLADHNIEGHAQLLLGTIQAMGLAELLDVRVTTLVEVGLSEASPDREVWRRAQELGMVLLTANRRRREHDSLEQTLREEVTPTSLPVLTISRARQLLTDSAYRRICAERVAEIIFDMEQYRGVTRLFVP